VKPKTRHCLSAALLLGCLLVSSGLAQYVQDSVDCGASGVGSLCFNPTAGVVYGVAQYGSFFAISADSNKIVSSTPFDYPAWVEYDSLDNKAYCFVHTRDYDTIMVMDGTTHRRIGQIPLYWANRGIWNPDNDRLYVSTGEDNKVVVIDCKADTVLSEIRVGRYPIRMTLNRRHQKLYVLNTNSESVSIVDLVTNEVIRTIRLSNVPDAGCYSAVGDRFFCGLAYEVVVIDGAADTVVRSVAISGSSFAMTEVPAHGLMMVSVEDGSLLVFSASGDSVMFHIEVGDYARSLVWSAVTDQVYGANFSNNVAVITGDGSRLVCILPVGLRPYSLALATGFGRLYVGHTSSRFVYVIRDTASAIEEPASGPSPLRVARAYPNPFLTGVTISSSTALGPGRIARVYSPDGREVRRLESRSALGGESVWSWDGRNEQGEEAPRGVYLVSIGRDNLSRTAVVKLR